MPYRHGAAISATVIPTARGVIQVCSPDAGQKSPSTPAPLSPSDRPALKRH